MAIRLACASSSFPADDLATVVRKAAWAGYAGVELTLRGATSDRVRAEDLTPVLRANEVTLVAVDAGVLAVESPAVVEATAARIGRAAVLTKALDGSRVVLAAPSADGTEWDAFASALRLLLTALHTRDLEVDVCVVNRAGTLVAAPGDWERLRAEIEAPRLALALDPAEALRAGWAPDRLNDLPVPPAHVYLNDAAGDTVTPAGQGEVDWPNLVAMLRSSEYEGYLSLALSGAGPWEVEPVAKETRELAQFWIGS